MLGLIIIIIQIEFYFLNHDKMTTVQDYGYNNYSTLHIENSILKEKNKRISVPNKGHKAISNLIDCLTAYMVNLLRQNTIKKSICNPGVCLS